MVSKKNLMTLKYFNVDFDQNVNGESANSILDETNPSLKNAIDEIHSKNLWVQFINSDF